MSETKKLTTEEITKVQSIRKNYVSIQNAFGQLHLTKLNLEKQITGIDENFESLSTEYENTQKAETEVVKALQDVYGVGTLNIEDGTFTPSSSPQ